MNGIKQVENKYVQMTAFAQERKNYITYYVIIVIFLHNDTYTHIDVYKYIYMYICVCVCVCVCVHVHVCVWCVYTQQTDNNVCLQGKDRGPRSEGGYGDLSITVLLFKYITCEIKMIFKKTRARSYSVFSPW